MSDPAVGGSIEVCTVDGRPFAVAADADANRDLGGFTNEVQPNGNATARLIKTRKPWNIDGLSLEISDGRGDLEFLQNIANGKKFVPITVTEASGLTYSGSGQIVGEVKRSSQNATAPIGFMGPDVLTQQ